MDRIVTALGNSSVCPKMPVQGFRNCLKILDVERAVQLQHCELHQLVKICCMLAFPVGTSWICNHSRGYWKCDVVWRRNNVGDAYTFFWFQVEERLQSRYLRDRSSRWHDPRNTVNDLLRGGWDAHLSLRGWIWIPIWRRVGKLLRCDLDRNLSPWRRM